MNRRFFAGISIAFFFLSLVGYLGYRAGMVPFFRVKEQTAVDSEHRLIPATSPAATPTPTTIPSLSLNRVFVPDHSWVRELPAGSVVVLLATGDVGLGRSVNYKMVKNNNFHWPFEKTAETLKSADITLINLEAPFVADCPPSLEGMTFCSDPKGVAGLVFAGVDVATLANNHLGDYGLSGVSQTKRVLSEAGILPVSENPIYKEIKGWRLVFLAYNDIGGRKPGVPGADTEEIVADIKKAKDQSDIIVVSFHWGVEYTRELSLRQQELAHLAVDAGADLVLGNHPHWIQPLEIYRGKLIAYAHGNFVFDQEWSEETKRGVVGRYVFFDKKLVDVEYLPIYIEDYGQPRILPGEPGQRILNTLKEMSLTLP